MQDVNANINTNSDRKRTFVQKAFGEFSWGRNLMWGLSLLCFIEAIWTTAGTTSLIRDGAFHSALLLGIAGYLSELRYRLIPQSRNN